LDDGAVVVVVGAAVVGGVVVLGVVVGLVVVGEVASLAGVPTAVGVGAAGDAGAGACPQPNAAAASAVAAATRPSRIRRRFRGIASMTSPLSFADMGVVDGPRGLLEAQSH